MKSAGTAALIAVVFGIFNFLFGWFLAFAIGLMSLPLILVSGILFATFVSTIVNTILLKLTDALLEDFELTGWGSALGMGLLFAVGSSFAERIFS